MGSATIPNAKPIPMENSDKKSLKTLIKSLFHKKKEKQKIDKKETEEKPTKTELPIQCNNNTNTVAAILENFNKLNFQEAKPVKQEKQLTKKQEIKPSHDLEDDDDDDELKNFAFKVIEEPRNERISSQSSEDSGFSDTKEENRVKEEKRDGADELVEEWDKIDLDGKKKKKTQLVHVARGPQRFKLCSSNVAPYPTHEQDYRQISQINKHTLTGGQVTVNHCQTPDNYSEIDIAFESVQKQSQFLQNDRENYLEDVLEYINEDTNKKMAQKPIETDYIQQERRLPNMEYNVEKKVQYVNDFEEKVVEHNEIIQLLQDNFVNSPPEMTNVMGDFNSNLEKEDFTHILNYVSNDFTNISNDGYVNTDYTYPTPPRSETVPSPMSASPGSFYPSNSEYTLSPERSPIYNSDYEKYQEIPHFEEEKDGAEKKARERTLSMSSMTMKQFKDMQKEIVYNFSKRDCCQMSRKTCKELFEEHLQKLSAIERKNLCVGVSRLDLQKAYGVLLHIMLSLATGSDKEDLQIALFGLVCDKMLALDAAAFIGDVGLNLLKSAALRCPHRPLLTRYLVQCVRRALSNTGAVAGKDHVFHEVDILGDNLVIACARAGDRCSDVLSELVRVEDNLPLFKLHHTNADGYTALHVACSQHSAASPRLHTVHVLLVHAGFDITEGDLKGRDTALHLAVNSAHCDLQLILLMFKQVDRKDWKSLAHWPNLSTKTPIDLARLATKTTTRHNYPQEVLEFLKKCR
ncbi:unnamed protein product [Chrysodeixis includens]|uniref:Uncharacterized protein n=1 Tax=Chrysodeixis includens TaxID=689277 RepID=A0A9P0C0B4_CHRIL|nr:unnamed protein product [Chrysodeixis includens]